MTVQTKTRLMSHTSHQSPHQMKSGRLKEEFTAYDQGVQEQTTPNTPRQNKTPNVKHNKNQRQHKGTEPVPKNSQSIKRSI
eukprot:6552809-Ditylum_brightwellii.AAC.1